MWIRSLKNAFTWNFECILLLFWLFYRNDIYFIFSSASSYLYYSRINFSFFYFLSKLNSNCTIIDYLYCGPPTNFYNSNFLDKKNVKFEKKMIEIPMTFSFHEQCVNSLYIYLWYYAMDFFRINRQKMTQKKYEQKTRQPNKSNDDWTDIPKVILWWYWCKAWEIKHIKMHRYDDRKEG